MTATQYGRKEAERALEHRREIYAKVKLPRNEDLPAGSPMVFRCIGCSEPIWVSEDYITKPDLCEECEAMRKLGWLE